MQVVWITRWDELVGLAPYWNALARGVPFRSWAWLGGWWRHYGENEAADRQLFALAVYDDHNELVGLAPWFLENTPNRGQAIRWLGSGDVCSDYLSLLCLPGSEARVAGAVASWLTSRHCSTRWDLLLLGGVDARDVVTQCFLERMRETGSPVYCQPGPNCWRIELTPTWDAYIAGLSKSHRKQVRRLDERLFATGRARLHSARQPSELSRGLDTLIELHGRRRSELGQRGAFAELEFAAFHQEIAEQLLTDGVLRLSWIELDGRPVAAEYQLAGNHAIYAYQSGIEPAALDFEPGRLAMIATLRRAIEDGYRWFDLLRGDEPYKAHWRARPRESLDVCVFSPGRADWLKQRAMIAGWQFRRWLRTGAQQVRHVLPLNGKSAKNGQSES